ncbi:MAG: hypothetical protein R3F25_06895 [Gammaproteobacteria bacterium]|nr:hypothetical protein [Xanthomonadales bacterium]
MKLFSLIIVSLMLVSCGEPNNHFRRQKAPPDVKINFIDIAKKEVQLRFEYRSYRPRKLEEIACQIIVNDNKEISIDSKPKLQFESFSTEIITFKKVKLNVFEPGQEQIRYLLDCEVDYDTGKEFAVKRSALYLVPGSVNQYR